MNKLSKEYRDKQYSALWEELGCFFAFNAEQFKEGRDKAEAIEPRGKYASVGHGMYCPVMNIDKLIEGHKAIKAEQMAERKKRQQVKLIWCGVDNWNRPVWRAPDQKAFFGDVNNLFDYDATEQQVREKVDLYDLCYFGTHFGCEPMGTEVPAKYYI